MRLFLLSTIFNVLVLISFCTTGVGQHIHQYHPPEWHSHAGDPIFRSPWIREQMKENVVYELNETGRESNWTRLYQYRHSNNDCEASTEVVNTVRSVEHQVCIHGEFKIGGKLEWAAKMLFQNAAFEAHAEVSFGGEKCTTRTETISISSTKIVRPCKTVEYTFDRKRHNVSFRIVAADHEFVCWHHDGPPYRTETRVCNYGVLTADGQGWDVIESSWEDLGKIPGCDCGDSDADQDGGN